MRTSGQHLAHSGKEAGGGRPLARGLIGCQPPAKPAPRVCLGFWDRGEPAQAVYFTVPYAPKACGRATQRPPSCI